MSVSDWLTLGGGREKENQSYWWPSVGNTSKEDQSIFPSLTWYQRIALFLLFLGVGKFFHFTSFLLQFSHFFFEALHAFSLLHFLFCVYELLLNFILWFLLLFI
jgi:hypothetical protein